MNLVAVRLLFPAVFVGSAVCSTPAFAQTPGCDFATATTQAGGTTILLEDMDCTVANGQSGVGPRLESGQSVDLAGFTLKSDNGIECVNQRGRCTIFSSVPGGMLLGAAPSGLPDGVGISSGGLNVVAEGITITNFASAGILNPLGQVTVRDVVVSGNGLGVSGLSTKIIRSQIDHNAGVGLYGGAKSRISDSMIVDNGGVGVTLSSLLGRKLNIDRSSISRNIGGGVEIPKATPTGRSAKAKIRSSVVDDNGSDGIVFSALRNDGSVSVRDSTVSGNGGFGVRGAAKTSVLRTTVDGNGQGGIESSNADGCRIKLRDSSADGNATFGVNAGIGEDGCVDGSVRLTGTSTALGNASDAACSITQACADIGSPTEPRVRAAGSCGTSYHSGSGLPGTNWNVCSLD